MNNIQRKGIGKMKIYKKVIACILTLMMFFAQMPVNVFAANQKNNIPLDIVLVLDVSGSMVDPITSTDTTKRITILKDSINQFIEEFAKNNSKQSDEKYQSRISIIKFSGKIPDNADKIGNDTYQENRNTYNYTQIMSDFFTATNDNKAKLEDVVNSISPAGATRSDFAMELALKQINQSKNDESRKDAKRIVFFVTDGQPTTFNNFDDDVANGAINTSKEIKKDAEVYTFGMFSLTDPSITGHGEQELVPDFLRHRARLHIIIHCRNIPLHHHLHDDVWNQHTDNDTGSQQGRHVFAPKFSPILGEAEKEAHTHHHIQEDDVARHEGISLVEVTALLQPPKP